MPVLRRDDRPGLTNCGRGSQYGTARFGTTNIAGAGDYEQSESRPCDEAQYRLPASSARGTTYSARVSDPDHAWLVGAGLDPALLLADDERFATVKTPDIPSPISISHRIYWRG